MASNFISRGFVSKRRQAEAANRVPPGQYIAPDFPVISAGPRPRTPLEQATILFGGPV